MSDVDSQSLHLGIDIGGTETKVALSLVDNPTEIVHTEKFPTARTGLVRDLSTLVAGLNQKNTLNSVGVCVPGVVSDHAITACTNVPQLVGSPLAQDLEESGSGCPVSLINDGAAAAVAETVVGAGQGCDDLFMVVLGTGVAGAHVMGGELVSGCHRQSGELGHIRIAGLERTCSCGATGCLETAIGAPALRRRWRECGHAGDLTELNVAWLDGDGDAREILADAAGALATAVLTLTALVDPGVVVLGGGVAAALPQLLDLTARAASAEATFHILPEIRGARLGSWAGCIGALICGTELAAARTQLITLQQ